MSPDPLVHSIYGYSCASLILASCFRENNPCQMWENEGLACVGRLLRVGCFLRFLT